MSTATSTPSPVGGLIVEATKQAQKKKSGTHTSAASCGCEVTVSFFSEVSSTVHTERCSEHPRGS